MGPRSLQSAKAGGFDPARSRRREGRRGAGLRSDARAIANHADPYETLLRRRGGRRFPPGPRVFGNKTTRGAFIINYTLLWLRGLSHAAVPYLKASGREESTTWNLRAGNPTRRRPRRRRKFSLSTSSMRVTEEALPRRTRSQTEGRVK